MSLKMLLFDYKDAEKEFFKKNKFEDFEIIFYETSLNEVTVENLPQADKDDAVIISVFITSSINEKVLSQFKNLHILTTRSTGYDHINIKDCCHRNIKVFNVDNYGSYSVVQYAFGLILTLLRKIITANKDIKNLKYESNHYLGRELNELTLGIVGTGAIGAGMCNVAKSFNMKILAFDVKENQKLVTDYGIKYTTKDELIEQSDIISLHAPLNEFTRNFITKREFSIMKPNAILINTSRGELVKTEDLYNALTNKIIAGAGLDVIECEELTFSMGNIFEKMEYINKECILKALLLRQLSQLDNVIITPHIAYETKDSIERILKITFNSIKNSLKGEHTNQVN
ncbi:MAG: NAD(P)-dependent oxidoreductase [Candidatus Gastranaerophilaceae bacterium]